MQTLSPLSADIFSVTPNGLSLPLLKRHFLSSMVENFYPRYTKTFIAIKKLLHRDEKKYLIPALYATSTVFVNFFVKIFPQKLRNKKVFLTLPCNYKIKKYEYENI
jgi:hypothetical protein